MIRLNIVDQSKGFRVVQTLYFEDGEIDKARQRAKAEISGSDNLFATLWHCKSIYHPSDDLLEQIDLRAKQ